MFNRIADKLPTEWWGKASTSKDRSIQDSDQARQWIQATEQIVKDHPGAALVVAFITGATIAWWLKRK